MSTSVCRCHSCCCCLLAEPLLANEIAGAGMRRILVSMLQSLVHAVLRCNKTVCDPAANLLLPFFVFFPTASNDLCA